MTEIIQTANQPAQPAVPPVPTMTTVVPPAASGQTLTAQAPASVTYAGFWRRYFASAIDSVLLGIVSFFVGILFGLATVVIPNDTEGSIIALLITGIRTIVSVGIGLAYPIYFIGSKGQTPGKMALGIKVVKADTMEVPGFTAAFLREAVGKFISAFVLLVGYLWMLWDDRKQTWHDKIAKTIVIKT